jgi:hypothetical protein
MSRSSHKYLYFWVFCWNAVKGGMKLLIFWQFLCRSEDILPRLVPSRIGEGAPKEEKLFEPGIIAATLTASFQHLQVMRKILPVSFSNLPGNEARIEIDRVVRGDSPPL